jgi:hypothetical protein
MRYVSFRAVLTAGLIATICAMAVSPGPACAGEGGGGKAILCPADVDSMGSRIPVRFDLARVRNAEKISKATLRLVEPAGKPLAAAVEVRPITVEWGGMSPEFRENEAAWTQANLDGTLPQLLWEQSGGAGKFAPPIQWIREGSSKFMKAWRLAGTTDWTWALHPVKKWKVPGGDLTDPDERLVNWENMGAIPNDGGQRWTSGRFFGGEFHSVPPVARGTDLRHRRDPGLPPRAGVCLCLRGRDQGLHRRRRHPEVQSVGQSHAAGSQVPEDLRIEK